MPSARQRVGFLGIAPLVALINEIPEEVRKEVLVPVVRAGGKVVKEGARFLAPVDEGDLAASIEQVERSYPATFSAVSVVGPARGSGRPGKRPAKYGHLAEFGHLAPDGSYVPGKPYMGPAVQTAETFAVQPMFEAAEKALDKCTDRLVRKYGHQRG
jgi:hypothetical protein